MVQKSEVWEGGDRDQMNTGHPGYLERGFKHENLMRTEEVDWFWQGAVEGAVGVAAG